MSDKPEDLDDAHMPSSQASVADQGSASARRAAPVETAYSMDVVNTVAGAVALGPGARAEGILRVGGEGGKAPGAGGGGGGAIGFGARGGEGGPGGQILQHGHISKFVRLDLDGLPGLSPGGGGGGGGAFQPAVRSAQHADLAEGLHISSIFSPTPPRVAMASSMPWEQDGNISRRRPSHAKSIAY